MVKASSAQGRHNTEGKGIRNRVLQGIISVFTALFLSITLIGSGLFVCCAPFTTESLATVFSRWQGSPFTQEELVKAAVATRDYTVESNNRDEVLRVVYEINRSALEDGRTTLRGAPDLPENSAVLSTDELAARFMLADDTYVLSDDALAHLDDVFSVVDTARIVLISIAIFALIGCIILGITAGRRRLGLTLISAAVLVLGLFAALAAWVIIDFNGFFAFLHSLFFTEGTWTFSADSLLIRMYPTEFWISMGAVWLATTVLACIICSILGLSIKGKRKYP